MTVNPFADQVYWETASVFLATGPLYVIRPRRFATWIRCQCHGYRTPLVPPRSKERSADVHIPHSHIDATAATRFVHTRIHIPAEPNNVVNDGGGRRVGGLATVAPVRVAVPHHWSCPFFRRSALQPSRTSTMWHKHHKMRRELRFFICIILHSPSTSTTYRLSDARALRRWPTR